MKHKTSFFQPLIVIWKIYFFFIFLLSMLVLFPLFYFTLINKKTWSIAFKLQVFWSYILTTFTGIVVLKRGADFPKPPFIVCSNHSSYLDIITMFQVVPEYFIFMGKNEIKDWPLFNIFFTKGMHILVDRKNPIKSLKAYDQAAKELDNGHPVIIFPEGTIWPFVPKMKPFKKGAFKMAIEKNIPIVPITFLNNYQLLRAGPMLKTSGRPGISRVVIHECINTSNLTLDDVPSLKEKVYQQMSNVF